MATSLAAVRWRRGGCHNPVKLDQIGYSAFAKSDRSSRDAQSSVAPLFAVVSQQTGHDGFGEKRKKKKLKPLALYVQLNGMANAKKTTRIAQGIAAECVGVRVRILNRTMTRIYDDLLRPHGIKFSQMNILTVIAMEGSVQPVEVVRILSIEKSTLSRNVRLMEANGWIERLPGDTGNSQLLRITPQGRQLYEKAAPAWRRAQKPATALLGERTTAALLRAVDRLQK